MEGVVNAMGELFGGTYRGRRVLVTGHTGFKGSWLSLWLAELGAEVAGYSLAPATEPSHWNLLGLPVRSVEGDILDAALLERAAADFQPEIVFHLAAQPLVRESYRIPALTFATNVTGSVNVYEACRKAGSVRAMVSITTDKVYRNREWEWGYRENDPFGGHDPYSASKACAEIATDSYRDSFWPNAKFGTAHRTLLATARAGNVVGGGDWAADRLVPDFVRAASRGEALTVRNPNSTRPWQHVLEPLGAYLLLGSKLFQGDASCAEGWNVGPEDEGVVPVSKVVERLQAAWPDVRASWQPDPDAPHEANLLKLDIAKIRARLGWRPAWNSATTFARTAEWYRKYYETGESCSREQLREYAQAAIEAGALA